MKKIILIILAVLFVFAFGGCSKEEPLKIVHITDPHFTGEEFSYEGTFLAANDSNGTGKQVRYNQVILDAFIAEMLEKKPDCIVVTGDLVFNGAKVSHLEFAEKFSALSEAGIKILVLPGNHDITGGAYIFPDGEPVLSDAVTPEEFREIYSDFGYSDAVSYDEYTLSYVYDIGNNTRIFMIDTNFMYGSTMGMLTANTIKWIEEQLIACEEAGATPIIAGHHSLLSHNQRFDISYKLQNGDEVAELMGRYGADLYLCGHMHTQHFVESDKLTDIVGGGFIVYPHRYGVIEFSENGWNYKSEATDVAGYAESMGFEDENLLNYDEYGYDFFYNNAYAQGYESLCETIADRELLEKYADFSARLNVAYFGGVFSDMDLSLTEDFLSDCEGTSWADYIKSFLADTKDNIECARTSGTE